MSTVGIGGTPSIVAALQRIRDIQTEAGAARPPSRLPADVAPSAFGELLRGAQGSSTEEALAPVTGGGEPLAPGSPLAAPAPLIGRPYEGTHRLGNWQSDNAVDLAVPVGTPVYAVAAGTIGPRIGPLPAGGTGRFVGQRLTLEGATDDFYYAHLSRLAVEPGQAVQRGQLLGWSGAANGVPHLHLASRAGDPLELVPPRATAERGSRS